ncbi:MAG: glycosyltransferase [Candidatus Eisenbacteria bacterium]
MTSSPERKRLLHVVSGLLEGGAEWMLYRLLRRLPEHGFDSEVLSLSDTEPMGAKMREVGVTVHALGLDRSRPRPWGVVTLAAEIRKRRPDVIQSWMYHADLAAGAAAKLAGGIPVVWGLHHANLDESDKASTLRVAKSCALLSSRLPRSIVCCSEATRAAHAEMGYCKSKLRVIPNGFDLAEFRPDESVRTTLRRELDLNAGTPLIGMVARYDPNKDHANLFRAAAMVTAQVPDARFVLCGRDVTWSNTELLSTIGAAGMERRTVLLGSRTDVPRILAALDIYVSSSLGEALPLVLGEAMASGVPCVATDVGDSAAVVGDTGFIVPPGDPEALGSAVLGLLEAGRDERVRRGIAARERIRAAYSLDRTAAVYGSLYREVTSTDRWNVLSSIRCRKERDDRPLRSARRASP